MVLCIISQKLMNSLNGIIIDEDEFLDEGQFYYKNLRISVNKLTEEVSNLITAVESVKNEQSKKPKSEQLLAHLEKA